MNWIIDSFNWEREEPEKNIYVVIHPSAAADDERCFCLEVPAGYLSCIPMQKCFLAGTNAGCQLKTKTQHTKKHRKRAKEAKCMVCYSVRGNTFVYFPHNIQRAICHPLWKAIPTPVRSKLYLAVDLQHSEKLKRGFLYSEVMDNGKCFPIPTSTHQKSVWGYDVNGNHVSPSDCKTCGFPLEVQRVASTIVLEDLPSHKFLAKYVFRGLFVTPVLQ